MVMILKKAYYLTDIIFIMSGDEYCINGINFSFCTFQLKQPKTAINIIEKLFKIVEPLGM